MHLSIRGALALSLLLALALPAAAQTTIVPPAPIGGLSHPIRIVSSAATTNLTAGKSTPVQLFKLFACNKVASDRTIKFYDAPAANVTVGTTAVADSRPLPGNTCGWAEFGVYGETFQALSFAITGGNADNDTTAIGAGDVTQLAVYAQ